MCDRDSPGAKGDLPDEYDDDEPVTHPTDDLGRCYKQEPMQGGYGKEAGMYYQLFSDFSAGRIQEWFEGNTRTGSRSSIFYTRSAYLDGKAAATSPDAYRRWDQGRWRGCPSPTRMAA